MIKIENENETFFSLEWEMGSCYGPKRFYDHAHGKYYSKYEANKMYIDKCCLLPGVYTLTCKNSVGPFGWGRGYIEIFGQRYCDDFVGYKAFRKIYIAGKYINMILRWFYQSIFLMNKY